MFKTDPRDFGPGYTHYTFNSPKVERIQDSAGVVHHVHAYTANTYPWASETYCIQLWGDLEPVFIRDPDARVTCVECIAAAVALDAMWTLNVKWKVSF